jgi:hypothetical protein
MGLMSSHSGATAHGPIDLDHLRKMTLSDPALEREVLGLFVEQTANLMRTLTLLPDNAAALAHTLKGSARARFSRGSRPKSMRRGRRRSRS